jgi:hypothetical protein
LPDPAGYRGDERGPLGGCGVFDVARLRGCSRRRQPALNPALTLGSRAQEEWGCLRRTAVDAPARYAPDSGDHPGEEPTPHLGAATIGTAEK